MSAVRYERTLPIRHEVDVFVAGGGPAGCAAAWAAAKTGARVFLAEAGAALGGMGTGGLIPLFLGFSDGEHFLAGDFGRALLDRMSTIGRAVYGEDAAQTQFSEARDGYPIHAESLKRAYEELLLAAGVDFAFHTRLAAVEAQDGEVRYCVLAGKRGTYAIRAHTYIDCTGDADLAAWAGASYCKGDRNGGLMGGTLCGQWTQVDWSRKHGPDNRRIDEAVQAGVLSVRDMHLPGLFRVSDTQSVGNIGHAFGLDGTDEASLTEHLVASRRALGEYERYYREYLDGCEYAALVSTGALMGVRETRIIEGEARLTLQDFIGRSSFEDEIGRFHYCVDIHASDDSEAGYQLYLKEYTQYVYKKGESYGIPYRVLLPKGLKNVLVAGRSVSTDRHIQSSLRVMPGCMITGQAAGCAASLCARDGCAPREIDVKALQRVLAAWHVYLPNLPAVAGEREEP